MVLAIPKGGVEVGYYVAEHLGAEFAMVIVRKLPLPTNPEAGFGAIAEDGSVFLADGVAAAVPPAEAIRIQQEQQKEIARRIELLRRDRPLPPIEGRVVILVDDGIAMGSTMHAAVKLCRNRRAGRVIVAAPVAGESAVSGLAKVVDEIVILEQPPFFRAVAEAYVNWYDVSDAEVLAIMGKAEQSQPRRHKNDCER